MVQGIIAGGEKALVQAIDLLKKADGFVRKVIELEKPTVFMQKDKNKEKRE